MGPTMKNHSKVISPLPFPFLREEWLGTATGLFGHRFLTNSGGRQCPSPPVKVA